MHSTTLVCMGACCYCILSFHLGKAVALLSVLGMSCRHDHMLVLLGLLL